MSVHLTETQLLKAGKEQAQRRLDEATKLMGETASLPPGNETRDRVVQEFRWAVAIAAEWGVVATAVEQIHKLRRRRTGGHGF